MIKYVFNPFVGNLDSVQDVSGFIPYTGASADADLGAFTLTASHLKLTTTGPIFSAINANTWEFGEDAPGAFYAQLYTGALTADQTYTMPNQAGTLALTSDLSIYAPIDNPTFTTAVTLGTPSAGINETIYSTLDSEQAPPLTTGNWTLGTGWSYLTGPDRITKAIDGTGTVTPTAATTIVAGVLYKVTVTIDSFSVGTLTSNLGGNPGTTFTSAGTFTNYIITSTTGKYILTPSNTARLTISAISIIPYINGTGNLSLDGYLTTKGGIKDGNGLPVIKFGSIAGSSNMSIGATTFPSASLVLNVGGNTNIGGTLGATTATFTQANINLTSTVATPSDGYNTLATSAASAGVPVRVAPSMRWTGASWNTTPTASSKLNSIEAYLLPVSGTVTSGYLVFANHLVDSAVNTTELMRLSTGGQLGVGAQTFLSAGNIINAYGTSTATIQTNAQNASNGNSASSDHVATADTGTDSTNYIDMGINSSTYNDVGYTIGGALSGYLYTNGGDLTLGTQTAAKVIKFHTGGTLAANLRATINDNGLTMAGSLTMPYVAKTADYTISATDYTVECTANSFTITLPTAVGITGRIYNIKNSGTGIITVDANSTETIDGELTQSLNQWDNIQIQSNGANWIIL